MSLWALYVVAINVFLSTSLFGRVVNFDKTMLDVHYEKGWSLFPGTIHAKHLSIRSSDSNVMWMLKLDEVEFDISFLALPQRRFQVNRARGTGLSMRMQTKRQAWPTTSEEIANLPPIPGFPAFDVKPALPHHPELWDDDQYELITVRLEDIIAEDVREVWIDDVRFSGHARIDGRFYLKPLRAVDIGPCHTEVHSGQVNIGYSSPVATDLGGTLDVTVDRFDPRTVEENQVLRYFTLATDLRARSAPLESLPVALPGDVYAAGIVDSTIGVKIDHGRIVDGTKLDAHVPRLLLARGGTIGEGAVDVHALADGGRLTLESSVLGIRAIRADTTELAHALRAILRADSASLDLAGKPFDDLHVSAELTDGLIPDARVANGFVPRDVVVGSGRVTLDARGEAWLQRKELGATARVGYQSLQVSTPAARVSGSGEIEASFGSLRWDTRLLEGASVASTFRDVQITTARSPLKRAAISGSASVRSAHLNLDDPLAALDATAIVAEGTHLDVALVVGGKPFHGTGDVSALANLTFVQHELAGFDARVRVPELRTRFGELYARAGVEGTARKEDGVQRADIALSKIGLGPSGLGITAKDAVVKVRSATGALDVDARVAGGRVHDPSAIASLLPKSMQLASESGTFRGDAKIAVRGDKTRARVNATTTALGVRTDKVTAIGDTTAILDITLDGEKVAVGPSRVMVANVRSSLGTARRIEVDGVATSFDRSNPSLAGIDAHIALEGVEVPDARVLQALISPTSKIRILSGALTANGEVAFSGENGASGTIAFDAKHAGLAIEKSSIEGDLAFRARVTGVESEGTGVDLSGTTLSLRNIEVKNAAAETRGWSGDVVLDNTRVGWLDGTPSLGADIMLTADDARPFLGMLLRDNAPKALAGLVTMPNLALRGRLDADPGEVALTDFYTRGGDVALRGSYVISDGHKRGAFIVAKSGLAVGVRIGDDGAHPRFFGLADWLRDEEKKVKRAPRNAAKH